ncbi:hypothetical protein BIW11_02909 [Tropilaelaps mercedesae]|uniref:Peptidase S1 domain-containing protein n=1 Tax=Tropilaelaps mercedesae TaxID=418985 RepID=A0A1V9XVA0_9ACAR|nr:hypothetical protein BIW11_02909 [Tropilaelaps mercedesae]
MGLEVSLAETIICTKHDLGSSCHGDSGGPLVLARADNKPVEVVLLMKSLYELSDAYMLFLDPM